MPLVRGDRLKPAARAVILSAYVHRNTREHPYATSGGDGQQTDAEWLRSHAFAVTKTGELDSRVKQCYPAYLANDRLTVEDVTNRHDDDAREAREAVKHAVRDWQRSCNAVAHALLCLGHSIMAPYEAVANALQAIAEGFKVARVVPELPPVTTSDLAAGVFYAWHFVGRDYQSNPAPEAPRHGITGNGNIIVRTGETLYVPLGASPCNYGLHSSQRPCDAKRFHSGPLLCHVVCWGEQSHQADKSVAQYRHVVAMHDVGDLLRQYRGAALDAECYRRFGVDEKES